MVKSANVAVMLAMYFVFGAAHAATRICIMNVDASCSAGWLVQNVRYTYTDDDRRNYYILTRSTGSSGYTYFDGVWDVDQKTVTIGWGNSDNFKAKGCLDNFDPPDTDCFSLSLPRETPAVQVPRKRCRAER